MYVKTQRAERSGVYEKSPHKFTTTRTQQLFPERGAKVIAICLTGKAHWRGIFLG